MGPFDDAGQALTLLLQCRLGFSPVADVLYGADQTDHPTLFVRLQAGQLMHPADFAIRPDDPVHQIVSAPRQDVLLAGLEQAAVVGMHGLPECFRTRGEVFWVTTEDVEDHARPVQLAVLQVDFPVAEPGDALGFVQTFEQGLACLLLLLALEGRADPAGEQAQKLMVGFVEGLAAGLG